MSTQELNELVTAFAQAAVRHYAFTQAGKRRGINREAEKIDTAYRGIKSHGDEGRRALLKLLESDDLAVSTMAATYCMHFAPQECKSVFQRALKAPGVLGLEAKYALKRFDDGSWQREFT